MKTLDSEMQPQADQHEHSKQSQVFPPLVQGAFFKKVRPFMGWQCSALSFPLRAQYEMEEQQCGKQEAFCIEDVCLESLLGSRPTPFYVTSLSAVEDRTRLYQRELRKHFPKTQVYYALKANWGVPLVRVVQSIGEGFDIVSMGELKHLLKLNVEPSSICYAGVGKTPAEVEAALESGVGVLNVEHLSELELALRLLQKIPSQTKIALRLNPALEIETHPHLKTGALDSKFGMLAPAIQKFVTSNQVMLAENSALGKPLKESIAGIHVHVGSQLLTGPIFSKLVNAVATLSESLCKLGIEITHLDFGGGLGVPLEGVPESGKDVADHVAGLHRALNAVCAENDNLASIWGRNFENVQVCLEPGRSIVASSTVFATKVLYTRENSAEHRFAYVDGGMNDFPRPSIYGAKHAVILGCRKRESAGTDVEVSQRGSALAGGKGLQIVGPVCESGDVLLKDAELIDVAVGDVLLFLEAGAYCRSMASEYNLRKLPETIYVRGDQVVDA